MARDDRLNVRVASGLRARVRAVAEARGQTVGEVVRTALTDYCNVAEVELAEAEVRTVERAARLAAASRTAMAGVS